MKRTGKKATLRKSLSKARRPRPTTTQPTWPFTLVERKFEGRKFVEFPQMKGKTLAKVELFTTPEYHSIKMDFEDRTSPALRIEPSFALHAKLYDIKRGDQEIREEWLPIHSATDPH